MIIRQIQAVIESQLFKGKAVVVIGARQVGKSTLLRAIASAQSSTYLMLNCDEPEVKELLQSINTTELRQLIGSNKIVFIDEAQRVSNIGMTLKLIVVKSLVWLWLTI